MLMTGNTLIWDSSDSNPHFGTGLELKESQIRNTLNVKLDLETVLVQYKKLSLYKVNVNACYPEVRRTRFRHHQSLHQSRS